MRVASLCPSNTEILAYLGLTDQLVAVDDYSDWPAAVNTLPKLGPDLSIDMNAVEKAKPDLVLASLSVPGMEKNILALDERGIPYITLNPQSLTDIENDLITVATALGEKEVGMQAAASFHEEVINLKKLAKQVKTPLSIYWEWWPKPVFTPGGTNWLTEISELVGGKNLFASKEQANIQTDWDTIRAQNPDVICLAWVGVRQEKVNPVILQKRPGWSNMDAMKNNIVYVLEEELFCRPSPRLIEGAIKLGQLLHPTIYSSPLKK